MNFFKPKFKPNRYIEKPKDPDKKEGKNISRRDFLKLGGLGVLGFASSKLSLDGFYKLVDFFASQDSPNSLKAEDTEDAMTQEEIDFQEKVHEENLASIREILDFDREGRLEFNLDSVEKVKKYWKKRYSEEPLINDFKKAFKEMGGWEDYLVEIFRQKDVPEEFRYLAIPESHWCVFARSQVGAVGPYQFMKRTAQAYGLEVNKNVDERVDPILSATACASLLRDLRDSCGDWPTALSGYNGGFIWKFLREVKQGKREKGYGNFLSYLEDKINEVRDELKNGYGLIHVVSGNDTIYGISRKYKVDPDELCKFNKIDNPSLIKKGQKIRIPINNDKAKDIFWRRIGGYAENLNYPAKFYAVLELINEGLVEESNSPIKFSWYKIKGGRKYKVEQGEWAYAIARKFGVSFSLLKELNTGINLENVRPGQILTIQGGAVSLSGVAKDKGLDIERLKELNPAILKVDYPLSQGYLIKV